MYIIDRVHFFRAVSILGASGVRVARAGSLWVDIFLSRDQVNILRAHGISARRA